MYIPIKEPSLVLLEMLPPDCERDSEVYDPVEVFDQVYSFTDLQGWRQELWTMFRSALSYKHAYSDPVERSNLVFVYSSLHDVLTAAYIILKKREDKKGKKGSGKKNKHK